MRFDMQLMGPVVLALLTRVGGQPCLMTPVVTRALPIRWAPLMCPRTLVGCTTSRYPRLVGLPSLQAFMVSILLFVDYPAEPPDARAFLLARGHICCAGCGDDIMALPAQAEVCRCRSRRRLDTGR